MSSEMSYVQLTYNSKSALQSFVSSMPWKGSGGKVIQYIRYMCLGMCLRKGSGFSNQTVLGM